MKTIVTALFAASLVLSLAACNDVHHAETTQRNWDGSTTHKETTVTEHPNGTVSVDESKSRVR